MTTVLSVLLVLFSLFLIVVVLLQPSKSQGLGAISGGAETFFGKSKAHGMEAMLSKATTVIAVLFILTVIIINML